MLHHRNKGSSRGQNVLIVLIWSCASKVLCQRSGSLELLQIGWGASKCDCAVNFENLEGVAKGRSRCPRVQILSANGYRSDPACCSGGHTAHYFTGLPISIK